jgi:hypothetical protein
MTLPTDSEERKNAPVYSGFMSYFPDAIAEVARLSAASNEKHNGNDPLHWSRDKSDDHADCGARHMLELGTMDDDGFFHDVKWAWRAMANLQVLLEERGFTEEENGGLTWKDLLTNNPEQLL